jgi:hypothetical protein
MAKVDGNANPATDNLGINVSASVAGDDLGAVYLYVQYQVL